MRKIRYSYWQAGNLWLGYLEKYPDYMTQADNLEELRENLRDIYDEMTGGQIPSVRHVAQLKIR